MKQTVPSDRGLARLPIPPAILRDFADLRARATTRSQLLWGEHCTECAYPTCYSSCAFYTPRQDLHCRRFEAGLERVADSDGHLTRIRFRRWGKLEAYGPTGLRPFAAATRIEATERAVSGALGRLPHALADALTWRWNDAKLARLGRPGASADAFVLEHWSPKGAGAFTLTFLEQDGRAGAFQVSFEVGTAYGRVVIAAAQIAARVDLSQPYIVQIEPVGEAAGREIVLGLADFIGTDGALPAPVPSIPAPAKVVVWDLDETLWDGVLAEDGPAGVKPKAEAVAAVKALDERGVIQSIASKNDHAEAMAALTTFGLADYFLHPQVSWSPKSQAILTIATRLDLGLDSVVFIDDQPFERAEVSETLAAVRTLPHTAVPDLLAHAWFDLPVTAESRTRRAMYQAETERSAASGTTGGDYLGFLRGSELTVEAQPPAAADLERVYELSQRTNQLNFTGAKLGRDEVAALVAPDPFRLGLTLRCSDRFGDYGLIGFAMLDLGEGVLDGFFMSCRVQRKRVEHAAFAHFATRLAAHGHQTFRVRFRATERNKASIEMLTALGFSPDVDGATWSRPLAQPFPDADVVTLIGAGRAVAA